MSLTPKEIVLELDKYIIGQNAAKKAVAVALRNRYRRSKLSKELREEITPKNIIMKGPTGVGKTEIARRLAKLVKAPFIKIEATKYTEVGYVGRDVESMVRDLVSVAIRLVKDEKMHSVETKAKDIVNKKLIKLAEVEYNKLHSEQKTFAEIEKMFEDGLLENLLIEIDVKEKPKQIDIIGDMQGINIGSMFSDIMGTTAKKKQLSVMRAREILIEEECDKLIDNDSVNAEAVRRVEEEGIIFIDEMDKIVGKSSSNSADVSREGVQRDILPIVEGSTVSTKYGNVKTDFILFIAAGAFHISKMEDMIPELQGRFPIRVELDNLTKKDFIEILHAPKNAITFQYASLLKVDNINLKFTDDALEEIADIAERQNETTENIGARRLHTIIEELLSDVSFNATGNHPMLDVVIDKVYVQNVFVQNKKQSDLKKYII